MIGKKKKIYLAGPMRGYPQHNFPAFDAAKVRLEGDWTVISPADMDRAIGFDPTRGDILDHLSEDELKEFIDGCIRRDVEVIQTVDAMAMLKGWEYSAGANAEAMLAQWRGIPIYQYLDDYLLEVLEPIGKLSIIENKTFTYTASL